MTGLLGRNPDFRRLWTAQTTSRLGERISESAIPLTAATTLHTTTAQVALVTGASSTVFARLVPPTKGGRHIREVIRCALGEPVLFADRERGLAPDVIGTAFGVGALVGAFLAPALTRRIGAGRSVVIGSVLFPLPLALCAAAGGPPMVAAGCLAGALFLSFLGVMLFDVNLNSLQVGAVSEGMRARVTGAYMTVNHGVRPLGALAVLWLLVSPIPGMREPQAIPTPRTMQGAG
ncbi:hypothetical protein [Streptomyces roseirectus]|uniref:hypothetical protein n=1 Tax=Streptomyces roseirectus TaxID=2768066 RepID=UPI001FE6023B|nr:hypothetical protein [Streptomyces roseirectus]